MQRVTDFVAVPRGLYKAGHLENFQMVRDVGLRETQALHQLAHALRFLKEGVQNLQARFIGQRLEQLRAFPLRQRILHGCSAG